MPRIIITREANEAIKAAATLPFRSTGTRMLQGGKVSVEVSQETYDRLRETVAPTETISDLLIRAIAAMQGRIN